MGVETEGVELFDPPPSKQRAAAGDLIRLFIGLIVVVVGFVLATVAEGTVNGVETDIVEGLSQLPSGLEQSFVAISQIFAILSPLALVIFLLLRKQWAVLSALFIGGFLASMAINALNRQLPDRAAVALLEGIAVDEGVVASAGFPSSGYLAGAVALVTLGAPWLSRRWKRFAWAWVVALVVARLLVASQPMLDLVLAIGVGMLAGSILLVVFGSPNTDPRPIELLRGLRLVGIEPKSIARWRTGESPNYWVTDRSDNALLVKARTPNDRSADLLNRAWRSIRFRSSEVDTPFSTIKRRTEHEAFMLSYARNNGVRVPEFISIGITEGESSFLALQKIDGKHLDEIGEDQVTDEIMDSTWTEVAKLHKLRIAHRNLALENVVVDAHGDAWLTDFDLADSSSSATRLGRDIAELLVGLAAVVGAKRAVGSAVSIVDRTELATAFRSLQPLALSGPTRKSLEGKPGLLEEVRDELCAQGGIEAVEPLKLERITPRTLFMLVAATLAFYTLLPQFGSLDDTFEAFKNANIGWIALMMLASTATYGFATVAFLGSVAQQLPRAASLRVQLASSFASLVGPSSTGQMALTGRFLQGAGLSAGDASAAVLLDTLAGLVAHVALMIAFFAWTGQSGVGGFSVPDSNTILLILTGVLIVASIALLFGPVRRAVVTRLANGLRDARTHIASVLKSPARVSALLGGSVGISLSYIAALVCATEAFGGGLSVAQMGTAFLTAAIVTTVAPTPGGLGAFEAAMVAALTGFGLNDGVAISSVLTYRLGTFWFPIIPGWFTFHWMQRHGEV